MYQTGATIKETIEKIQRHEYVLPAIQREFVWKPEQIERLFDSLMQGYPFGTFLLWHVEAQNASKYRFYDFVREYHQRDHPHCPQLPPRNERVTAVLDGQQRLTALNIGLCGSMAYKEPKKWWNNPDAFPTRFLYLDVLGQAEADEEGDRYRFDFLTEDQAAQADAKVTCWFRVADILNMQSGPAMLKWLNARLEQDQLDQAYENLDRLFNVVHNQQIVAYYEERSQDLSTVLNIFIRMNSGGTVLSYSDLLLSIAVAQWERRDARQEIHSVLDELNQTGENFTFSQDLVLKAGLLLTDIKSIAFKVENFNHANMAVLEDKWSEVKQALGLTVRLIASFGYNGRNLRAASAILPIAYYLYHLSPGERYLTTATYAEDRERVRSWLTKSLLKSSGIWGGLDTLLAMLRDVIRQHGRHEFPIDEIEKQMARRGRALSFENEEIEELVELRYGDARTFALLSLLFPFIDFRNHFHVDHVFPRAEFHKSKLRQRGLTEEQVEQFQEMRDGLPNLQLLDGAANIEKQSKMPAEWLEGMLSDEISRASYLERHLLGRLPTQFEEFPNFYEARRQRLVVRISELVGRPHSKSREPAKDAQSYE